MPTRLHLQLALDHCTLPEALALAERAAPVVDSVELGTPFLIREGVAGLHQINLRLEGHPCALFADTKISDEGALIARICLEAGADALSVVDGASTRTLQEVRAVADEFGRQVWVDLLYHSNPIIRARALAPYADGFIVHRPRTGFPPLLVEGLMAVDRPIRLAGGLSWEEAQRAVEFQRRIGLARASMAPMEGLIVGRAITQAPDVGAALAAFAALCHGGDES